MHLAYVTPFSLRNQNAYSGTSFFMARAIEGVVEQMTLVDDLREPWAFPLKVKQQLIRTLSRRDHHRDREPLTVRAYARQVARRRQALRPDVLFGPSTLPLAGLPPDVPFAFWPDATFAAMVDFYPEFTGLSRATLRNGHRMERAALHHCRLALYSSDWAAASAVNDYGTDPAKVKVVPYGANLEAPPAAEAVARQIAARPPSPCRLLFLGKDWARKGGPLAVQVAEHLSAQGLPTTLTVLGARPAEPLPACVEVLGFVDKATPAGQALLERTLAATHFMIVPSRADCTPIVFCEAAAYGIPCLSTTVGGIPSVVQHGRTGGLFALGTPASAYAAFVQACLAEPGRYAALAAAARRDYETRLNWATAAAAVRDLLAEALHG